MEREKRIKGPMTLEDGTEGMFRNVGSKLPIHAP